MKLYQTYASPFPTRVRLLLYAKGIAVEIIEPPGFHSSPEAKGDYLKVNPVGRVPTLVLDDGRALPESEVICEYLEDAFPEPSLRPADPWGRAQVRLISRLCDFYLVMAMVPLFNASGTSRRHWDAGRVSAALQAVETALGYLESDKPYSCCQLAMIDDRRLDVLPPRLRSASYQRAVVQPLCGQLRLIQNIVFTQLQHTDIDVNLL